MPAEWISRITSPTDIYGRTADSETIWLILNDDGTVRWAPAGNGQPPGRADRPGSRFPPLVRLARERRRQNRPRPQPGDPQIEPAPRRPDGLPAGTVTWTVGQPPPPAPPPPPEPAPAPPPPPDELEDP